MAEADDEDATGDEAGSTLDMGRGAEPDDGTTIAPNGNPSTDAGVFRLGGERGDMPTVAVVLVPAGEGPPPSASSGLGTLGPSPPSPSTTTADLPIGSLAPPSSVALVLSVLSDGAPPSEESSKEKSGLRRLDRPRIRSPASPPSSESSESSSADGSDEARGTTGIWRDRIGDDACFEVAW